MYSKKELQNLIEKNEMESVMQGLKEWAENGIIKTKLYLSISGNYSRYKKDSRMGILSYEEDRVMFNKIQKTILSTITDSKPHGDSLEIGNIEGDVVLGNKIVSNSGSGTQINIDQITTKDQPIVRIGVSGSHSTNNRMSEMSTEAKARAIERQLRGLIRIAPAWADPKNALADYITEKAGYDKEIALSTAANPDPGKKRWKELIDKNYKIMQELVEKWDQEGKKLNLSSLEDAAQKVREWMDTSGDLDIEVVMETLRDIEDRIPYARTLQGRKDDFASKGWRDRELNHLLVQIIEAARR